MVSLLIAKIVNDGVPSLLANEASPFDEMVDFHININYKQLPQKDETSTYNDGAIVCRGGDEHCLWHSTR